jgi:hypothetical protein
MSNMPTGRTRATQIVNGTFGGRQHHKQALHRMAQNNKKQMQIIATHPDADGLASSKV